MNSKNKEKVKYEFISGKELDQIKKRCKETTPGPWIWYEEKPELPHDPFIRIIAPPWSGSIQQQACFITLDAEDYEGWKNADFICQAREDIMKLVTAVEQLQMIVHAISQNERVAKLEDIE